MVLSFSPPSSCVATAKDVSLRGDQTHVVRKGAEASIEFEQRTTGIPRYNGLPNY